jgi:hypothetical protein
MIIGIERRKRERERERETANVGGKECGRERGDRETLFI